MTWNYRLVKKLYGKMNEKGELEDKDSPFNSYAYGIHECFYDENGKIWGCTVEPINVCAERATDVIKDWFLIADAFKYPIVNYEDIPEVGSESPTKRAMEDITDEEGNIRPTDELITEGKLVSHEVVMKNLRDTINEKAEEKGELHVYEPDYEFDIKEYRNEEVVEQKIDEDLYKKEFENVDGKGDLISKIITFCIEGEENG